MHDKVTDIASRMPHNTGDCICLGCKHTWVGVTPVGIVDTLECPSCGLMKGTYAYLCEKEGPRWECNCGCQHFFIRPEGVMCVYCGISQTFPEF